MDGGWQGQGLRNLRAASARLSSAFCLCSDLYLSPYLNGLGTEAPEPSSASQSWVSSLLLPVMLLSHLLLSATFCCAAAQEEGSVGTKQKGMKHETTPYTLTFEEDLL